MITEVVDVAEVVVVVAVDIEEAPAATGEILVDIKAVRTKATAKNTKVGTTKLPINPVHKTKMTCQLKY